MSDRPTWLPDVRLRQRRSRAFLVRGNDAFELNETALFVWRLCDGTRTIREIAKVLSEATGAELERVEEDCGSYVEHLKKMGVIRG